MPTLIDAYEVAPGADEQFVAGWERARDFLSSRDVLTSAALHRPLRADVAFRFVSLAHVDSAQRWQEAVADHALPDDALPFPSHPALYEVVHEDGSVDGAGGVVLINPFEVDAGSESEFRASWDVARELLSGQRGYLGTRLHRAVADAVDFRFVNVARWSSPLMFSRAMQRRELQQPRLPFRAHPALYQVVRA
jgi:heme-degrading monooxygenase HmoA